MNAIDTGQADPEGFQALTAKQAAVLGLLANGRTSKEIATALDLSESAVNRRIELLRTRFGGITRLELARRFRDWSSGVETARQSLHLADETDPPQKQDEDGREAELVFRDSLAISIDPPWAGTGEPKIVPGVLDGDNAVLTRGAAIAIILLAIVASLVLGLAAASALTDTLGR